MNSEYSTHPGWHVPLLSGVVLKFFAFEGLLEALCIFFPPTVVREQRTVINAESIHYWW